MRAWALKSRPAGTPVADNFQMIEATDAPLGEGEYRITNSWLSVDPYMRGRMNDVKSYAP
ncbi:MAG: NADP-dependent oxidoreductase, partial [Sphingomonadales bacterium]|nr:NADP-dependent oxidoreductase [Sphingomonadales bacterium]NCQ48202.1 NADP-dependent oxidoreductase [Sphingomonadales bacterium]